MAKGSSSLFVLFSRAGSQSQSQARPELSPVVVVGLSSCQASVVETRPRGAQHHYYYCYNHLLLFSTPTPGLHFCAALCPTGSEVGRKHLRKRSGRRRGFRTFVSVAGPEEEESPGTTITTLGRPSVLPIFMAFDGRKRDTGGRTGAKFQ